MPLFAFLGGLTHVWAVYQLARTQGRTDTATLILAGVAINALAGALIGLTLFFLQTILPCEVLLSGVWETWELPPGVSFR